jgi:hypothetical protein
MLRSLRPQITLTAVLLLTWFAQGRPLAGMDVWVDAGLCIEPGSGSESDPFCRIQDAICDIKDVGGSVFVRQGTYSEAIRLFPGVSVLSTDGPSVTTIDATGQPCITKLCSVSTTDLSCSTVTLSSVDGVPISPSDRLEGFLITGGAGRLRDFGTGDRFVVGGGIFIFNSSPTITNNEISGNTVSSNANLVDKFLGGGIYIHSNESTQPVAAPVISQNLIEGNSVDPPAGRMNAPASGLGGGIYTGYWASPQIRGNTLLDNIAGNRSTSQQIGGGGGIALYTKDPAPEPLIQGNVFRGNYAADLGGGIYVGWTVDGIDSPSIGLIESNLVEYNDAIQGGGISSKPQSDHRLQPGIWTCRRWRNLCVPERSGH